MTLVSVTAYHSFGGEVEASNTPTIRRLTPSCRHQLPPIARSHFVRIQCCGCSLVHLPCPRATRLGNSRRKSLWVPGAWCQSPSTRTDRRLSLSAPSVLVFG